MGTYAGPVTFPGNILVLAADIESRSHEAKRAKEKQEEAESDRLKALKLEMEARNNRRPKSGIIPD